MKEIDEEDEEQEDQESGIYEIYKDEKIKNESNKENNIKNIKINNSKIIERVSINLYQANEPFDKLNNLDLAIKMKNIEKIIIYFSKICYYINSKKLIFSVYKKNFDVVISKLEQIRPIFEEINNPQKISNLILGCIKNNILSQIYLYILISQIIFEKDNSKSDEIMSTITNLFDSLIASNDKYYLLIYFASYYILINIKQILNYIDIKKACEFLIKIIPIMNNSFSYYTYLSKILKINKTKEIIEINNDRNSKLVEDIDNINNLLSFCKYIQ